MTQQRQSEAVMLPLCTQGGEALSPFVGRSLRAVPVMMSGVGVTASTSLMAESPLRLPDYRDLYGQGLFGGFRWVDSEGGGLWDVDGSCGPRLDGRLIDRGASSCRVENSPAVS